jgi:hypothetical protein
MLSPLVLINIKRALQSNPCNISFLLFQFTIISNSRILISHLLQDILQNRSFTILLTVV